MAKFLPGVLLLTFIFVSAAKGMHLGNAASMVSYKGYMCFYYGAYCPTAETTPDATTVSTQGPDSSNTQPSGNAGGNSGNQGNGGGNGAGGDDGNFNGGDEGTGNDGDDCSMPDTCDSDPCEGRGRCDRYPEAECRAVKKCDGTCEGKYFYNDVEVADCSSECGDPKNCPFTAMCAFDVCKANSCPAYPEAQCVNTYCRGCGAQFCLDGVKVDCYEFPADEAQDVPTDEGENFSEMDPECDPDPECPLTATCDSIPCGGEVCPDFPNAQCINRYCEPNACTFAFCIDGKKVNCTNTEDFINTDTDEANLPTCEDLPDPTNGAVSTPGGTDVGDTATYTCRLGFVLKGEATRTCGEGGEWSGQEPSCFVRTVNDFSCTVAVEPVPCTAEEFSSYPSLFYYDPVDGTCKPYEEGTCAGNENAFNTIGECQAACKCHMRESIGNCFGMLRQWRYDMATHSCKRFIYGGCGGNTNRFYTEESCVQSCEAPQAEVSVSAGTCEGMEPETGRCRASLERFFYNAASGKCETFIYGGCDGNDNRFETLNECESSCRCYQPKEVGPCEADMPMWYFDQTSGSCQEFSYGGCEGNANRFPTRQECSRFCSK